MTATLSEVLIEVWRQGLVDKSDTVKIGLGIVQGYAEQGQTAAAG